ncbi:class I SAM-dependent methyltransferase [Primorskyibacter sp. 2E107]|uniref:class I SAM-dependent methyltransferase n=1 Tax=Primorskyibacter sp. 2E107 TaxID=3403458 RepID=UPI003AF477A8
MMQNASRSKRLPPIESKQPDWEKKWSDAEFAPWWHGQKPHAMVIEALARLKIPKSARWLDVGCGDGQLTCALADQGMDMTGIDFAPSAIALARAHAEKTGASAQFAVADAMNGPIPGAPYDIVHDRGCLHTIRAPGVPLYARTMRAHMKDHGRLLLAHKEDGKVPDLLGFLENGLKGFFTLEQARRMRFSANGIEKAGLFCVFRAA